MPWVKLDDHFADHPKLAAIDAWERPLAVFLHIMALCWCNRHLTDGFVPKAAVERLAPELVDYDYERGNISPTLIASKLVACGLWEENQAFYIIHDYLEYQPSREEVLALRETRSQAGRKGGLSKSQAKAKQNASNVLSKTPSKIEAKVYPGPDPDPDLIDRVKNTRSTRAREDFPTVPLSGRSHHRSHAHCGRVCVPAFLHDEFRRALPGDADANDRPVRDWYLTVEDAWAQKAIGDDALVFWRARFAEWQGTTKGQGAAFDAEAWARKGMSA